jgi:putative hemolysin
LNPDSFSGLLLIIALILLRGLIVLAYNAFANVRQSVLRDMAEEGNQGASRLLALVSRDGDLQVAYQTARTMLSLAIAAVATLGFSNPLIEQMGEAASPMAVHIGVLVVTLLLTLIFGELVPEGIGSAYAHTLAMSLTGFMQVLIIVLKPLTLIIVAISKAIATIFKSSEKVNTVTEEEIVTLVESGQAGGSIEEEEKDMILSVLQLDETYASEVMVPRIDITALSIDTSVQDALTSFIKSGFSRIPLYENTIDNIKGLLYAKDLLSYWHNGSEEPALELRDLMRPAYFVPETKRADDLLKELQSKRVHMAIVIDEFGGTAGIVTIENIIEEIIGDIQDEHDPFEEAEYIQESETEYMVDASIDIDDFNDLLDVEIPGDDSDTLGGFVYTTLGRVPVIGEEIKHEERGKQLVIRVEKVEGRRIRKLHVVLHKLDEHKLDEARPEAEAEIKAEETARTSTSETPAAPTTPVLPVIPAAPAIPAVTATSTPAAATASPDTAEMGEMAESTRETPPASAPPSANTTSPTTQPEPASPASAASAASATHPTNTETAPTDTAPSSDAVPVTPTEAKQDVVEPSNNVATTKPAEPDPTIDMDGKTVVPGVTSAPISSEAVPLTPSDEAANSDAKAPETTPTSAASSSPDTVSPSLETVASDDTTVSEETAPPPAAEPVQSDKRKIIGEDSNTATPTTSTTDEKENTEDGTQPDQPRQPVSERP